MKTKRDVMAQNSYISVSSTSTTGASRRRRASSTDAPSRRATLPPGANLRVAPGGRGGPYVLATVSFVVATSTSCGSPRSWMKPAPVLPLMTLLPRVPPMIQV